MCCVICSVAWSRSSYCLLPGCQFQGLLIQKLSLIFANWLTPLALAQCSSKYCGSILWFLPLPLLQAATSCFPASSSCTGSSNRILCMELSSKRLQQQQLWMQNICVSAWIIVSCSDSGKSADFSPASLASQRQQGTNLARNFNQIRSLDTDWGVLRLGRTSMYCFQIEQLLNLRHALWLASTATGILCIAALAYTAIHCDVLPYSSTSNTYWYMLASMVASPSKTTTRIF